MVRQPTLPVPSRAATKLLALCGLLFIAGCPPGETPQPGEEDGPPDAEAAPPAALDDEDFRGLELVASGVDPSWRMEIERGGRLTLTPVFGMEAVEMPAPDPERDDGAGITTYVAELEDFDLRVDVHELDCQDPRGGETFDATVHVLIDDRELIGCGSWLRDEP